MPRPLKKRPRGVEAKRADISPELIEALSLAGVPCPRIGEMLGLSERTISRRFGGHMKHGPKIPAVQVAGMVAKLIELAGMAATPEHIPHVVAALKILGPLHLHELARSWQPAKESDGDLPPISPTIGYSGPPDAPKP